MRVTNNILITNLKRNLSNSLGKLNIAQNQLATGQRISKPSDDPAGIVDILRLKPRLAENQQYQENVDDAMAWMANSDESLDTMSAALNRMYELTVYAANGILADAELNSISAELQQISEEFKGIVNSTMGDKYIFAGTLMKQVVYDETGWHNNTSVTEYEISKGVTIPVNLHADQIFKVPQDIFQTTSDLIAAVEAGDSAAINASMDLVKQHQEQALSCRAQLGARMNRLELTDSRLKELEINYTSLRSDAEDIDPAQVMIDLKSQESVYQSALSVGARIIVPSLMDYLR